VLALRRSHRHWEKRKRDALENTNPRASTAQLLALAEKYGKPP
jgi:hypothetical protein